MSPDLSADDLRRLDTLFEQAADLAADDRASFVERECGANRALARELAYLLAGLESDDLLARAHPSAASLTGSRIGPYRLLERVGEGGMGEVYEAEQLEPVVRRVALKIIKPGLDSADVVTRFQAERQALARMRHPCVAQIYGGGTTEEGRLYFVMEYIDGEPITAYCDRHLLSTRARLELFLDACAGVHHAHQKGLLHRDLKPSNLLVTIEQGRAQAKVIDFGVARATSGHLGGGTLVTRLGQIVGTLGYMSPEQSDPGSSEIDTRSDVYSLGVVLYELVSGLMPFDRESMAALSFAELQRMLRERDPDPPSTRLRRQPGTATSIAPLHGTEAHLLIRQLSGDLDWICLKALDCDPSRRYASVSELASDVRRHLAHEPVLARPPSALYSAGKFARRHRTGVGIAGVAMLALSTGLYGSISGRLEAVASELVAEALRPAADLTRLQRLMRRADDELWPLGPELVDGLSAWIDEARDLAGMAGGYRIQMEQLRHRALPERAEELERERERVAELERERAEFEREVEEALSAEPHEPRDRRIAQREHRIRELESELGARAWSFVSPQDQSMHDILAELVAGLDALSDEASGLLSPGGGSLEHGWSIPRRLELARDLRARSQGGEAAGRWQEAVRSIGDPLECPQYAGLAIEPQLGLMPIGRDPHSGLWEFAHLLSGEPARRDAGGELELTPESGVVLVLIPAGTFTMGARQSDAGGPNDDPNAIPFQESPPHDVVLPAYFLSKFELTEPQWSRATQPASGDADPRRDILPVGLMTWIEADVVMRRLGLALPHEEQWEYAARAGTSSVWYTGSDEHSLQGHANIFDQTAAREAPHWEQQAVFGAPSVIDDGSLELTRVGSYLPNPFGLHDVHGNIMEWCDNPPYSYQDGTIPPQAKRERVVRGGCTRYNALAARSAVRFPGNMAFQHPTLGIRPARAIEP